jgi:hypothetical protein
MITRRGFTGLFAAAAAAILVSIHLIFRLVIVPPVN